MRRTSSRKRPGDGMPGAVERVVVRDDFPSTRLSEQTLPASSEVAFTTLYGVTISPTGLLCSRELTFEEWEALGCTLEQRLNFYDWAVSDWWCLGSHRYGERAVAAAKGIFGYEFGTLMKKGSVARRVETLRRSKVLSFTHHEKVASLAPADQVRWLDTAVREKLTTRQLEQKIEEEKIKRERERVLTDEERAWHNDECARSDLYELEDAMQILCAKSANTEPDELKRLLFAPGNALLRRSFCGLLNETDTAVRSLRELAEPKSNAIRDNDEREAA